MGDEVFIARRDVCVCEMCVLPLAIVLAPAPIFTPFSLFSTILLHRALLALRNIALLLLLLKVLLLFGWHLDLQLVYSWSMLYATCRQSLSRQCHSAFRKP